jgi:hypothetical protein
VDDVFHDVGVGAGRDVGARIEKAAAVDLDPVLEVVRHHRVRHHVGQVKQVAPRDVLVPAQHREQQTALVEMSVK